MANQGLQQHSYLIMMLVMPPQQHNKIIVSYGKRPFPLIENAWKMLALYENSINKNWTQPCLLLHVRAHSIWGLSISTLRQPSNIHSVEPADDSPFIIMWGNASHFWPWFSVSFPTVAEVVQTWLQSQEPDLWLRSVLWSRRQASPNPFSFIPTSVFSGMCSHCNCEAVTDCCSTEEILLVASAEGQLWRW